jgi:hypothetical protein
VVLGQEGDDRHKGKQQLLEATDAMPDVIDPTAAAATAAAGNAGTELADKNYELWLEDFYRSGIDPRSLEWVELLGDFGPPVDTLDKAVDAAALIVSGMATNVEFLPGAHGLGEARVTFAVDAVVKGAGLMSDNEAVVVFGGGPHPDPTGESKALMGYFAPAPLLLEGDQAVLLLKSSGKSPGTYVAVPSYGVNKVVSSTVTATEGSPVEGLFNGKLPEEVLGFLDAAGR